MSYSYITVVTLNYTFHFYRIHRHVTVSHEKDSFNKHLRNCRFYSAEVDSSVLRIKSLQCFKNRRKTLMLQVWKFSYVWLRYLLFLNKIYVPRALKTSISSLQNLSFLAHCTSPSFKIRGIYFGKLRGHFLQGDIKIVKCVLFSSFFKIERSDPIFWGKCPGYGNLSVISHWKCSFRGT